MLENHPELRMTYKLNLIESCWIALWKWWFPLISQDESRHHKPSTPQHCKTVWPAPHETSEMGVLLRSNIAHDWHRISAIKSWSSARVWDTDQLRLKKPRFFITQATSHLSNRTNGCGRALPSKIFKESTADGPTTRSLNHSPQGVLNIDGTCFKLCCYPRHNYIVPNTDTIEPFGTASSPDKSSKWDSNMSLDSNQTI